MAQSKSSFLKRWLDEKHRQRGARARSRQLEYQEKKAQSLSGQEKITALNIIARGRLIRQRLEKIHSISNESRVLEVGCGAHGLIFGFESHFGIGIDPLAVDYKRLFPLWQQNAKTVAAIGEELPFADSSFDVVLSDNVIDHAENPIKIIEELVRVLKSGGLLYFTVNIHHPVYDLASKAHGAWNALGIHYEISPFADHTVHFSENQIRKIMIHLPLRIVQESSTIAQTKASHKQLQSHSLEHLLKKVFFKNALYEVIAIRD